jgi:hypothetical protein
MRARTFVSRALSLALASEATIAFAQGERVSVRIDCPMLAEETRATVEARAQAELISRSDLEGVLDVTCRPESLTVGWTAVQASRRQQPIDLKSGADDIDDRIIAAVHLLVAASIAPPIAAIVPAVAGEPRGARSEAPVAPARDVAAGWRPHFAADVGSDVELWHGRVGAAVGGDAAFQAALWPRWMLGLTIAPQWGLGSPQGLEAWALRSSVRVEYELLSRVRVGTGVSGRIVWIGGGATTPTRLDGVTGGPFLSARYVLLLAPFEASMGPRVDVLGRPVVAEVAGSEVFRVPSLIASLSLDIAAPSSSSRR